MSSIIRKLRELPPWAQWMPVVIVILLGFLIGSLIDLKNAKSALAAATVNATETAPSPAKGKISYQDARVLYDQLKKPVGDTVLFNKKSFQERVAYMQETKELEEKLEVFGTPSQCRSAGIMRTWYVRALHTFANAIEGKTELHTWEDLTAPMFQAFSFGNYVAGCYDEIASLDEKR